MPRNLPDERPVIDRWTALEYGDLEEETADIFADESDWSNDAEPSPYHDDDEGDEWPYDDEGDFFGEAIAPYWPTYAERGVTPK